MTAYAANLKSPEGISAVIEAAKGVIPGAATPDFEEYSRLKVPTLAPPPVTAVISVEETSVTSVAAMAP